MNNIKIRVWDSYLKRFLLDSEAESKVFYSTNGEIKCSLEYSEISLWSGYPDSDGKDIYESDFVEYKHKKDKGQKGLVVYKDGCFWIEHLDGSLKPLYSIIEDKWFIVKVIGTQYKNEDLRKD